MFDQVVEVGNYILTNLDSTSTIAKDLVQRAKDKIASMAVSAGQEKATEAVSGFFGSKTEE